MRVLVTGAGGFLGRHVVQAAAAEGHEVVALLRPTATAEPPGVEVLRGDLRQRGPWVDEVGDLDAVVHLAAATSGDLSEQFAGTVVATENLLDVLQLDRLSRFVHVSSIAVYDFTAVEVGGLLDESTPIEPRPERRDAYTTTKLLQEVLVRDACDGTTELVVLRPGAVYGPGKDWSFGVAARLGAFGVVLAPAAHPPLTHVRNCADAIVAALDAPHAAGRTVDIVDDELPTYLEFARRGRAEGADVGRLVGVPWSVVDGAGGLLALVDERLMHGRMKLPEVLVHRRQQARWKPIEYSNAAAKAALGWTPAVAFDEGVESCLAGAP